MPMYEYGCKDCGEVFELLRSIKNSTPPESCPHCKKSKTVVRKFGIAGVKFKGDGFYVNREGSDD